MYISVLWECFYEFEFKANATESMCAASVRWTDECIAIHMGNSSGNTGQGKRFYFSLGILGNFYTLTKRTISMSQSVNQSYVSSAEESLLSLTVVSRWQTDQQTDRQPDGWGLTRVPVGLWGPVLFVAPVCQFSELVLEIWKCKMKVMRCPT